MINSPESKPFVWHERGRPICGEEMPQRCRKTALWYMDGLLFCDEHVYKVNHLYRFIRPIVKP